MKAPVPCWFSADRPLSLWTQCLLQHAASLSPLSLLPSLSARVSMQGVGWGRHHIASPDSAPLHLARARKLARALVATATACTDTADPVCTAVCGSFCLRRSAAVTDTHLAQRRSRSLRAKWGIPDCSTLWWVDGWCMKAAVPTLFSITPLYFM